MQEQQNKGVLFINNHAFTSLRSADYSTYYALAELVDNSIQADAKNIHIVGIQHKIGETNRRNLKEVIVFDDGKGMNRTLAEMCLQLGGGDKYDANAANKNLGKYGIGLTQGSMSQTPRVDVYTWENRENIYYNYLDFEELARSDDPYLPAVRDISDYPTNIEAILDTIKSKTDIDIDVKPESGTIIHWKNCDRLDHKTYRTFFDKIEYFIGRVYRYYIDNDNICISVSGLDKKQNGYTIIQGQHHDSILPNDPMFLIKNSIVGRIDKRFKGKATNEEWAVVPDIEVEYKNKNGEIINKKYDVEIKFSHTKEGFRDELTHGNKTTPGSTDLGQLYKKNMGISLMRSDRELKCGEFNFIGDRSDPTNRWWSVEVNFHPDCDDAFGVTFDKQEAKKFKKLSTEEIKEAEESNDPDSLLLKKVSQIISNNISEMKKVISKQRKWTRSNKYDECPECGKQKMLDNKCESCGYVKEFCPNHPDRRLNKNGVCPICSVEPPVGKLDVCPKHPEEKLDENGECPKCKNDRKQLNEKDIKNLKNYLKEFFTHYDNNEELLQDAIEYYKSCGRTHVMVYTEQDDMTFISSQYFGDIKVIEVNKNHDFYIKYMQEIIDEGILSDNRIIPIHLLISAFVNAHEHFTGEEKEIVNEFRVHFNMNLKKLMRYYDYVEYEPDND